MRRRRSSVRRRSRRRKPERRRVASPRRRRAVAASLVRRVAEKTGIMLSQMCLQMLRETETGSRKQLCAYGGNSGACAEPKLELLACGIVGFKPVTEYSALVDHIAAISTLHQAEGRAAASSSTSGTDVVSHSSTKGTQMDPRNRWALRRLLGEVPLLSHVAFVTMLMFVS